MKIKVTKIEYWDGSKYMVRMDKSDANDIMYKLKIKKQDEFLALPLDEQVEFARKWGGNSETGMVKRTVVSMDEKEYLKITKI